LIFRLRSIRKKGREDEERAQQEDSWIRIIEEKAMKVFYLKNISDEAYRPQNQSYTTNFEKCRLEFKSVQVMFTIISCNTNMFSV